MNSIVFGANGIFLLTRNSVQNQEGRHPKTSAPIENIRCLCRSVLYDALKKLIVDEFKESETEKIRFRITAEQKEKEKLKLELQAEKEGKLDADMLNLRYKNLETSWPDLSKRNMPTQSFARTITEKVAKGSCPNYKYVSTFSIQFPGNGKPIPEFPDTANQVFDNVQTFLASLFMAKAIKIETAKKWYNKLYEFDNRISDRVPFELIMKMHSKNWDKLKAEVEACPSSVYDELIDKILEKSENWIPYLHLDLSSIMKQNFKRPEFQNKKSKTGGGFPSGASFVPGNAPKIGEARPPPPKTYGAPSGFVPNRPCAFFFNEGKSCKHGAKCKFSHDTGKFSSRKQKTGKTEHLRKDNYAKWERLSEDVKSKFAGFSEYNAKNKSKPFMPKPKLPSP